MVPEPSITQIQEQGLGVLMMKSGDIVPNEQIAFIIYGPDLLLRDRALGRRFMVAYLEGMRQYMRGPTLRNVAIMAEYTELPAETIRKAGRQAMFADGRIEVNRLRQFQDWLYEIGLIAVRNPMASVVDTAFIDYANGVLDTR